jgi:hypothetical protein
MRVRQQHDHTTSVADIEGAAPADRDKVGAAAALLCCCSAVHAVLSCQVVSGGPQPSRSSCMRSSASNWVLAALLFFLIMLQGFIHLNFTS